MSLLFKPEERSTVSSWESARSTRAARLPSYVFRTGGPLTANIAVNVDASVALAHDAYWACVTRISQDVAMYPVDVLAEARRNVQAPEIIAAPSVFASPLDWRVQVVAAWLTTGDAWGLVTAVDEVTLKPRRIELQEHDAVHVQQMGDTIRYVVNGREEKLWPVGRLWKEPGYTMPGQHLGVSVVQYHAATIARGLAAGKMGTDYFTDGAHPTAILTMDDDPGEEDAKTIKAKILGAIRGNREPLLLPSSVKWHQIQTDPTDSQFIETMRYSVEQVCRVFGEDPADYGAAAGGDSVTYANRTDAEMARIRRRQFWVTKMQDALTRLVADGLTVRLNTSATLMMTPRERHELHQLRLDSKTRTVNEVRVIEDEMPFGPEFDEPGIPAVLAPDPVRALLAASLERSALPPAPAPVPAPVEYRHEMNLVLPDSVAVSNVGVAEALRMVAERRELTADDLAQAFTSAIAALPAPVTNVDVAAPNVTVEAPQVTVEAPNVTVEVAAPVVNLAPQPVQLTLLKPDDGDKTKTVKLKVGDKTVTGTITESA